MVEVLEHEALQTLGAYERGFYYGAVSLYVERDGFVREVARCCRGTRFGTLEYVAAYVAYLEAEVGEQTALFVEDVCGILTYQLRYHAVTYRHHAGRIGYVAEFVRVYGHRIGLGEAEICPVVVVVAAPDALACLGVDVDAAPLYLVVHVAGRKVVAFEQ